MTLVVLTRHGPKVPADQGRPDHDRRLHEAGAGEALDRLADALDKRNVRPDLWLASHFDHCWQTAARLNRGPSPVYRICGLTPWSAEEGFRIDRILQEAANLGAPITAVTMLGIVGHEERLSRLANALIARGGITIRPLDFGEVVVVEAVSQLELSHGGGRLSTRW